METATPPTTFVVQDLWLAAVLIALGFRLKTVEGRRKQGDMSGRLWARFQLEDRPDRPNLVRDYYAGTLACPVAPLRSALNLCRDAMRNSVAQQAGGGHVS